MAKQVFAIQNAILTHREVSACECAVRMLSLIHILLMRTYKTLLETCFMNTVFYHLASCSNSFVTRTKY